MFKIYDIFEPTNEGKPAICGRDSHGSTLTELPDGRIMVAWYSGPYEKSHLVGIYSSIFTPSTQSWTPVVLLEKENEITSEGNPVLYYDSETKRLWLFWVTMSRADYAKIPGGWSTCKVKCRHSDDLGENWSSPKWLTHFWGRMTRNRPLRLSNGDVLLPLYSEWMRYRTNIWMATREEFAKGAPECQWKNIAGVGSKVLQPNIVELEPGHLLCYMRTAKNAPLGPWISVSESKDYGRHWAPISKGPFPNSNSGLALMKLKNGHLAMAFNNCPTGRTPLSLAISEDNGKTWPYVRDIIHEENERFCYPEIIQATDGTIYVSYTNKRGINICCVQTNEEWIKGK
jgi:predicted neuraminidase